jgi:hypothetical protein
MRTVTPLSSSFGPPSALASILRIAGFCALAGCGWSKPAAQPENAEESASSSEPASAEKTGTETAPNLLDRSGSGGPASPPPATKATITDDSEKKESHCDGSSIPDLLSSISEAACELPQDAPPPPQKATKEVLDIKAAADTSRIVPGSTAKISLVFTNVGKAPLSLDFVIDPDPRFAFELYTPKGGRVDKPAGSEPTLPPEVADAPAADPHTARVTLAPRGKATLVLPWQAVRYKWASKEKAKGALPGRGYPREPAGPLPKGKYVLRVITPLTDVDESAEHELSQPRLSVEVGGTAANIAATPAAAPRPEPPAPVAAKKPVTPAPISSDADMEARVLKAMGSSPPPAATKKKAR